jgi:hypothetical protein
VEEWDSQEEERYQRARALIASRVDGRPVQVMARKWWHGVAGAVLALGVAMLLAGRHRNLFATNHAAHDHDHPTATPLEPAAAAAPGSGRFFDAVAPSYDLLNRLISL